MNAILKTGAVLCLALVLIGCDDDDEEQEARTSLSEEEKSDVLANYAAMAHAAYSDSHAAAQTLHDRIDTLVDNPSPEHLNAAKTAYRALRVAYSQTEVMGFDEDFVTPALDSVDEREGQISAWPLDEGFIDYVDSSAYDTSSEDTTDIIAESGIVDCGQNVDVDTLDVDTLIELNQCDDRAANVATGIHAIEFLLWGQDVNGTDAGAGERPYTDFDTAAGCTNRHCDRRVDYIQAAADLLVADIQALKNAWGPAGATGSTALRDDLLSNHTADESIHRVLYGLGSLALGGLAGDSMQVALDSQSPEDEQDDFSDLTHVSLLNNAQALENVYLGTYKRPDSSAVTGTGLSDLVAKLDPDLDEEIRDQLDEVMSHMQAIYDLAEADTDAQAFDQQIGPDGDSDPIEAAIDALVALAALIEEAADEVFDIDNLASDGGAIF